jgi:hypothetical protein
VIYFLYLNSQIHIFFFLFLPSHPLIHPVIMAKCLKREIDHTEPQLSIPDIPETLTIKINQGMEKKITVFYQMNHRFRGKALIFNNLTNHYNDKIQGHEETSQDVINFCHLLRDFWGFRNEDIHTYTNLCSRDIERDLHFGIVIIVFLLFFLFNL